MKRNLKILLPVFFFSFIHSFAFAQLILLNPKYVSGKLVDNVTSQSIPFVYILNESQHISALSDTTGKFTIRAKPGDTLVFSVIGYLGKYIVLEKSDFTICQSIPLTARSYDIAEVEIFGIPSYSQFKEKLKNLKMPETETDRLRQYLEKISLEVGKEAKYELAMKKAAEGGSLASVPFLSAQDLERIKLKEIMKEEKIQAAIDKKYNRQMIGNLTGLKDIELDEFILFCKFSKRYLQFASEYDIMVKVLEKYKEFKEMKNKGSIQMIENYAC